MASVWWRLPIPRALWYWTKQSFLGKLLQCCCMSHLRSFVYADVSESHRKLLVNYSTPRLYPSVFILGPVLQWLKLCVCGLPSLLPDCLHVGPLVLFRIMMGPKLLASCLQPPAWLQGGLVVTGSVIMGVWSYSLHLRCNLLYIKCDSTPPKLVHPAAHLVYKLLLFWVPSRSRKEPRE